MIGIVPLIILFPAIGIALNLTAARWMRDPRAGIVACVAAALSFLVAVLLFLALVNEPEGQIVKLMDWISFDTFRVAWAFQVDTLSVTMMLVITGIGTLIHVYAVGYMRGDERSTRFFVFLNLFLIMMLVLVSADNYLMLFAGWEGVGLCSFLLIGFWFDEPGGAGWKNSSAARKAFIVNRIGDFGLLLAIIMIWWLFGSLRFHEVFQRISQELTSGTPLALAITLLIGLGAVGKSAQVPLFIWLPDAMAGPTPASALIHAATMVTAGIYIIVRSHTLFALAPLSQTVIAVIGAVTALFAASAALGQYDIKRVLAYSTISQLGFMIAAVGMGAYNAGMFHLITHAFFKALLFLGAGSIIHALGHGNDMRAMGGLRTRMPTTFWSYTVGAFALAGMPPLAGFFSKDEILTHAFEVHIFVYLLLSAAAFLTALYTGRQWFAIFFGDAHSEAAAHVVENPRVFTMPLVVLSALTILGGAIQLPGIESLARWMHHSIGEIESSSFQPAIAGLSVTVGLLGFGLAYWMYGRQPSRDMWRDPLALGNERLFNLLQNGWLIDNLIERTFVRVYNRVGSWLARGDHAAFWAIEQAIVRTFDQLGDWLNRTDHMVFLRFDRKTVRATARAAGLVAQTETGKLNWNVFGIVGGMIVVLILVIWIGGR